MHVVCSYSSFSSFPFDLFSFHSSPPALYIPIIIFPSSLSLQSLLFLSLSMHVISSYSLFLHLAIFLLFLLPPLLLVNYEEGKGREGKNGVPRAEMQPQGHRRIKERTSPYFLPYSSLSSSSSSFVSLPISSLHPPLPPPHLPLPPFIIQKTTNKHQREQLLP